MDNEAINGTTKDNRAMVAMSSGQCSIADLLALPWVTWVGAGLLLDVGCR